MPIVPWKPSTLSWGALGVRVWRRFREHHLLDHAASLSFYFLLSLFPLLVLGMSLVGSVLRSDADTREAWRSALTEVVPPSALRLVDGTLHELTLGAGGATVWAAGLIAAWSAVRGTRALIVRLNVAYDTVGKRSPIRRSLLSIALSIATLILLAVASAVLVYGSRLGGHVDADSHVGQVLGAAWWLLSRLLLLGCAVLVFGLFYAYAPRVSGRRRRWISFGAVVGVVLWTLASVSLRLWMQHFRTYTLAYGSVGAVIVLQLWLYLTALALLLGAEVNAVLEEHDPQARVRGPISGT